MCGFTPYGPNSSDRSLHLYDYLCILFLMSAFKESYKMLRRFKKDIKEIMNISRIERAQIHIN